MRAMVTAMATGTAMATTTATAMTTTWGRDADGDGDGDGSNDITELQSMLLKDRVRHASSTRHSIPGLRRGLTRHTELSRNVPPFLGVGDGYGDVVAKMRTYLKLLPARVLPFQKNMKLKYIRT